MKKNRVVLAIGLSVILLAAGWAVILEYREQQTNMELKGNVTSAGIGGDAT